MDVPPSPNYKPNFPADDPPSSGISTRLSLAMSTAQETTRVDNIRLRRELEEAQMSNALLRMGLRIGAFGVRPSEAIDVLAVYGESQPLGPQGPPSGSH
nr:hypothetical protein [Tanacetum cinerariifolium]